MNKMIQSKSHVDGILAGRLYEVRPLTTYISELEHRSTKEEVNINKYYKVPITWVLM